MFAAKKMSTIFYYQEKIQSVKNEISRRLNTALTIQELADFSCVSYHHLCDIFHQVEGLPIKQFINDSRINMAAGLLCTTEMSLNEIAYKVGYMNKSSLSKAFKRKFEMAPGEYRRTKGSAELLSAAA